MDNQAERINKAIDALEQASKSLRPMALDLGNAAASVGFVQMISASLNLHGNADKLNKIRAKIVEVLVPQLLLQAQLMKAEADALRVMIPHQRAKAGVAEVTLGVDMSSGKDVSVAALVRLGPGGDYVIDHYAPQHPPASLIDVLA